MLQCCCILITLQYFASLYTRVYSVQTENYDHKLRHYYVTTAPEAECDIRVSPEYLHPSMVMSKWLKSERESQKCTSTGADLQLRFQSQCQCYSSSSSPQTWTTNQTNTDGSPRRILGYTRQPSSIRGELTSARPTSDSTITAN